MKNGAERSIRAKGKALTKALMSERGWRFREPRRDLPRRADRGVVQTSQGSEEVWVCRPLCKRRQWKLVQRFEW